MASLLVPTPTGLPMTHHHLSPTEHYQIQAWLEQGLNKCQIAGRLGCHRSTIYRELARCEGAYSAECAQRHRQDCALCCAANAPRYGPAVWCRVRKALVKTCRSPQQIAGRAAQGLAHAGLSEP